MLTTALTETRDIPGSFAVIAAMPDPAQVAEAQRALRGRAVPLERELGLRSREGRLPAAQVAGLGDRLSALVVDDSLAATLSDGCSADGAMAAAAMAVAAIGRRNNFIRGTPSGVSRAGGNAPRHHAQGGPATCADVV